MYIYCHTNCYSKHPKGSPLIGEEETPIQDPGSLCMVMPWLALPLTIQGLEQLMKIHTGYPASKYVCVFLLVDLSDELGI